MKSKRYSLPKILLEIASHFPEEPREKSKTVLRKKRITAKINQVKRCLSVYNLKNEELYIFAVLFDKFMERETKVYGMSILYRIYSDKFNRLEGLEIIYGLMRKRLLDIRGIGKRIAINKDAR